MTRIKTVNISSFRGIPGDLKVSFNKGGTKSGSLLILGDNGCGKSSIVDAIEFCLQGHISQAEKLNNISIPSIISYSNKLSKPKVKIEFDNGETYSRHVIKDEQGYLSNQKTPNKNFSISPFVLRRHDLLKFINSSDAERTLVFANYLRNNDNQQWYNTSKDELKNLQDSRLQAKENRDKHLLQLANELNIQREEIPMNSNEFRLFIKQNVFKGFSKKQIESNKFKIKINEKLAELANQTLFQIEEHRRLKKLISDYSIDKKIQKFPSHLLPQLKEFLSEVGKKLTKSFLAISPLNYIETVKVSYEEKNALALIIEIRLKNKSVCSPKQILSEANLDLLALLFFISFIEESAERGQSKFLILDDVLQSVDSTIRVSFLSFLLNHFKEWQIFITAHDRLWFRQLTEIMNSVGHSHNRLQINNWGFNEGPHISEGFLDTKQLLEQSLIENEIVAICSRSGLLLEEICEKLSVNFSTSIQRKKGDRYTIGDLWPGIVKKLKNSPLSHQASEVNKWLHLRNIIGAHYNEWAHTLSLEEARNFGKAVVEFNNNIVCNDCHGWISKPLGFEFYSCKCGNLKIDTVANKTYKK